MSWGCPKAEWCESCGSAVHLVVEVRPFFPDELNPRSRVRYACATLCWRCFQQCRRYEVMFRAEFLRDRMAAHERGHRS